MLSAPNIAANQTLTSCCSWSMSMNASISNDELLAKLFYSIGKQSTPDWELQQTTTNKEGVKVWHKRVAFLGGSVEALRACNHRGILHNEVVIDIDSVVPLNDPFITELGTTLSRYGLPFCIWHTGSKGLHANIYNDKLVLLPRNERENKRREYIREVTMRIPKHMIIDEQKTSDKVMLALENVPHWKTGRRKTLVIDGGVWMTTSTSENTASENGHEQTSPP